MRTKIAFRTFKGIEFLTVEEILYCQALGRYSKIITKGGKEYLLTKVLKQLEDDLPTENFFRTHKSYLINLNYLSNYNCNHELPITLQNNVRIKLAKRRKSAFHQKIRELVYTL